MITPLTQNSQFDRHSSSVGSIAQAFLAPRLLFGFEFFSSEVKSFHNLM